jgi:phage FluMu protein Com
MNEQVKCPICGRRLFDKYENSSGQLEIKCIQCKQIVKIRLENKPPTIRPLLKTLIPSHVE